MMAWRALMGRTEALETGALVATALRGCSQVNLEAMVVPAVLVARAWVRATLVMVALVVLVAMARQAQTAITVI